jgi:hypothetical protein
MSMKRILSSALVFFALSTMPVMALNQPPTEPSYDRPSFDPPSDPPGNPPGGNPPERSHDGGPNPKQPPKRVVAPPPVEHVVVCEPVGHQMQVKFSPNVEPRFYKEGQKFCHKLHPPRAATLRCVDDNGSRQIQATSSLGKYASKKANRFCMCIWGLD